MRIGLYAQQGSSVMKGKVVVITGASAGVGRATARRFARHGWRIALMARGQAGLRAAAREVRMLGGEALILPTDVADSAAVEAAAEETERRLGPIDVWVNNAMVSVFGPVKAMSAVEFQRVTQVTYLGYVWGTLAALKRMLPRDRGTIVQVGSALAYRSIPLQSAYCAAKHAIVGFTTSLRCELIHDRSRVVVTMVHLPAVNTPQFDWVRNHMGRKSKPVGEIYQPEVAARAVYFAAHQRRREIYVGMPTVQAIFANRIAPSLLDYYAAATVYEGHMTDEPDPPNRPDNLFAALPCDFGARGPYSDESHDRSWQLWLTQHRKAIAAGTLALLGMGWLAWRQGVTKTLPSGSREAQAAAY